MKLVAPIIAIIIVFTLVAFHNQALRYQNQINQTTKTLQSEKEQQRLEDAKRLQELQQKSDQQQQQIEELQKQVGLKKAQQDAALAAAQAAQSAPPVQVAQSTNCEAYRPLVAQYGWNTAVAMAIMHAESGCNPVAYHVNSDGSTDGGLMQINSVHIAALGGNLNNRYDPATNVRVAYSIYLGSGWHAWSVFTSGAYLRYL